jgi:hypothetical protein
MTNGTEHNFKFYLTFVRSDGAVNEKGQSSVSLPGQNRLNKTISVDPRSSGRESWARGSGKEVGSEQNITNLIY